MQFGLVLVTLVALFVYGATIAGALEARASLRVLGVASGLIGIASIAVYVPIAWQTRAFLRGSAETFPGMTVYSWATLAALCALALGAVVAFALHRAGVRPKWPKAFR